MFLVWKAEGSAQGPRVPGTVPVPSPPAPHWEGRLPRWFSVAVFLHFTGPESGIGQHGITLQVPDPTESQAERPSSLSVCTELAAAAPGDGGESPIVQSDEEGVEVDTALATLHTDDSDS